MARLDGITLNTAFANVEETIPATAAVFREHIAALEAENAEWEKLALKANDVLTNLDCKLTERMERIEALEADLAAARARETRLVERMQWFCDSLAKGMRPNWSIVSAMFNETLAATPDDVKADAERLALAEAVEGWREYWCVERTPTAWFVTRFGTGRLLSEGDTLVAALQTAAAAKKG